MPLLLPGKRPGGPSWKKEVWTLSLALLCAVYTSAQIAIVNPSFEGGFTGASITPPPWLICTGTVDTEPCCGGSLPASHGTRYLGIWDSAINPESTGQQLGTPLVAGATYTMSMDMYKATGDGIMELYGGNTSCATTQLMWSSPPIANTTSWVTYTATFVPSGNWGYIRFNTKNNLAVGTQLFIDNISAIYTVPVKLLQFTAKAGYGEVVLSWATADENISHFIIERSTDGAVFHELGSPVQTAGALESRYAFTDKHPAGDLSYYRLKQADISGNYTYSHIVKARLQGKINIKAITGQDPGMISFVMEFPARPESVAAEVLLTSISGQTVIREQLKLSSGAGVFSADRNNLPSGIYIFSVLSDQFTGRQKIVIP